MRILIDILHPAHVHVFREFRREMTERGHAVLVASRNKDLTVDLLDAFEIPHEVISTQGRGRARLAVELGMRTARLVRIARAFRPDVMTGIMGPSIALTGRLLKIPAVVLYDTEIAPSNRWVYPMAASVLTPDSYTGRVRGNHVTYPSYHELAYLHPSRFQRDPTKLSAFGLAPPYSVVRFVSWEASHDFGESGLELGKRLELVRALGHMGQVVISSEGRVPQELDSMQLAGPAEDIHQVLAHAQLVVGESTTMSSEAALLGVPTLLISRLSRGYVEDQERHGLIEQYSPARFAEALDASVRLAGHGYQDEKLSRLLETKIDLTSWLVEYFEQKRWSC